MPSKKKASKKRGKTPVPNSWIAFLRRIKGQNLSQQAKTRLYKQEQRALTLLDVPSVRTPLIKAQEEIIFAAPDCYLTHDMNIEEMCLFVARVAPLKRLGFRITGIVGSGSYGLVLDLINACGVSYVMKVSRICETRGTPIRFPILNNQKTSWHTINYKEFRRGVRAQQKMCNMFKNIRIPHILHAGCVDLYSDERLGLIIMQKVNGITLRKVLNSPSVPVLTKQLLVQKYGKIVARLHRAKVVHGDFHTWNTLCDASGHLYLIDFDRTSLSTHSAHRLHDLLMSYDTMDEDYWPQFTEAYFGVANMSAPCVLKSITKADRKKELHEQSRDLFGVYLTHLREHEKTLDCK